MPTKKTSTASSAAASRQALAEAKGRAATWATEHAAAVEAVEELIARLSSGDPSPTVDELMASEFAVKRAALLRDAGASLLSRAERALVNDDTRLADLFADVLGEVFGWLVPVRVVTVAADVAPDPKGEPVAFLLQEKPSTDDGGILSGELRVTFYRSSLLAPLDPGRIEEATAKRGHQAEVIPWATTERGDQHHDTALIRVREAAPEVPVLSAAPSEEAVRRFAQGVVGRLSASVRTAGVGVHLMGDGPSPNAKAELISDRILETSKADDGERVALSLTCRVTPSPSLKANPHPLLTDVVNDLVGLVEPGLGRVAAVQDVQIALPDQTPFAWKPWTVTARVVIAYSIGTTA